ncbi:MAG: hypothetical protein K2G53_08650 [Muribaculaceae bacterium]|nr:hypothetical protein [Muribaculaceae bacterium]
MRIPPKKDIMTAVGFLFLMVTLVLSCAWVWDQYITNPPYVDPERYPVRGVDVSAHNGEIDFEAVKKDGMEFAFLKASEGVDFRDKAFAKNYEKAQKAGIKTGAYHFFRFDKDGVDQAINFLEAVGDRKMQLGLAIDVEQQGNPDTIPAEVVVERLTAMTDYLFLKGIRAYFYTNKSGYENFLLEAFPGYPLWICSFSSHPIDADWSYWQFNHHGKVKGIKGDVDLDTFNGTREEFLNSLNQSN